MRKRLLPWLTAAVMLIIPAMAAAQVGQTAVLTGTVTDSSGAAIPGATVTVQSPSLIGGSRSVVTEADGTFRFPALPPGLYTVTYELQGFSTGKRDNVRLLLGQTVTADQTLSVGGLQESVMVSGQAPIVDVTSSSAQKNLPQEIMEFIPFTSRFGPGAMLLAPGVNPNNYSSYGSGGSSSNSYMIDGVDVSDPEGGTIWVFANHNWIQEVQVIGLGANAEFGGFTGVASNSLFRSGSNIFSGLVETLWENDALTDDNTTDDILALNPDLTAGTTDYITDSTLQIGGPIKQDKAWFFTSFQYYRPITAPAGFPPAVNQFYTDAQWTNSEAATARVENSPRFLFKPTVKLGENDQLTGFFETDMYRVDGRAAFSNVAPIATLHQDSPEVAWNINYTKVLTPSSVFDIKYSGFWGYYYLSPYNGDDTMGWYDVDEDLFAVNSYYFYNADRTRNQANASITQFASGFAGDHNLKFGAEFERSTVVSELGYPGGGYVLAYSGVPYYGIMWDGYLRDTVNTRLSAFAQDAWQVNDRLTINPGIRVDHNRGYLRSADDTVFKTTGWGPRVGFAFDVTGTGRTVFRGHWGRYYDGAKSTYYSLLEPANAFYLAYLDTDTAEIVGDLVRLSPEGQTHTMDPDIKHPRMDQAILGLQHELFPNFSVGVTGIYRKNVDFIDDVLIDASNFSAVTMPDPGPDGEEGTADDPGGTLTFYERIGDPDSERFLVTNPDDGYREYRGVELMAEKRFSDRWMVQASWVISKIEGNINNTGNFGNSAEYDTPNTDPRFQPFRDGRLTNDNTHLAKVLGMWQGPWGIVASGAYFYTSGGTFNRTVRERIGADRWEIFAEPRGAQRLDARQQIDGKLEKQFNLGDRRRLGLTLEGFNLLNTTTITNRFARSGDEYLQPRGLNQARRFRLGAVLRF